MRDQHDRQTIDAFAAPRRGRKPTGHALTPAQRKRAQRAREQYRQELHERSVRELLTSRQEGGAPWHQLLDALQRLADPWEYGPAPKNRKTAARLLAELQRRLQADD